MDDPIYIYTPLCLIVGGGGRSDKQEVGAPEKYLVMGKGHNKMPLRDY